MLFRSGGAPGAGGVNDSGYAFNSNGGDTDSGIFSSANGQLEFYTDAAERAFTDAREAVRGGQTFTALCAADQTRIENVLFSPFPPWEDGANA